MTTSIVTKSSGIKQYVRLDLTVKGLAVSEKTAKNHRTEVQTLAYNVIDNETVMFYDDERIGSNILYLPNLDIDDTAILHLFNILFIFIHTDDNEVLVSNKTVWVIMNGYYLVDSNLTIPFGFLVTVKQAREMYKKVFLEFAKQDSILNEEYNYTISPSIVLELTLMPSLNKPSYGEITLQYFKYLRIVKYITTFSLYLVVTGCITILLGSLLICTAILKYKNLRTPPNVYVFSSSMSDIIQFMSRLIGLVLVKLESNDNNNFDIIYITSTVKEICWYVVCWTTIGITIDRYIAICHPFLARRISTYRRAVKINITIWALSFIVMLMKEVYSRLYIDENDTADLASQSAIRSLILLILTPLCTILPAYICIALSIRKSSKIRHSRSNNAPAVTDKSVKIAAAIAVQFIFCFSPSAGFIYVIKIFNPNKTLLLNDVVLFSVNTLDIVGCMLHPVLYALLSTKFRNAFKDLILICLGFIWCCGKGETSTEQNIALN